MSYSFTLINFLLLFSLSLTVKPTIFGERCKTIVDTRNNYNLEDCKNIKVHRKLNGSTLFYECCHLDVYGRFEGISYRQSTCMVFLKDDKLIEKAIKDIKNTIQLDNLIISINCGAKWYINSKILLTVLLTLIYII